MNSIMEQKETKAPISKRRLGSKTLRELNRFRKSEGLPLLEAKERSCLRCGKTFKSVSRRTCGCLKNYDMNLSDQFLFSS